MQKNYKYKLLKLLAIFISLAFTVACGGGGSGDRARKSIIPSGNALKSNRPSGIADGVYTLYSVFDKVNDAQNCMAVDQNQREKTQVITVTVSGSTCMATSAVHDPAKNILDLGMRGEDFACKISGNSIIIETRFTTSLGNSCTGNIHEILRADANNGHVVNDCQTEPASENKVSFNANIPDHVNSYVGCAGFEARYSSKCSDEIRSQSGCQYLASVVMVPGNGREDGGDISDPLDTDGDGISNESDNCPNEVNADQLDTNHNAVGDACEGEDRDGDGYSDMFDNCPWVANHDQVDANGNALGDACEQPIVDDDGNVIGVGVPGGVPYDDLARRLGHALDLFRNAGDGNGDGVVEGDARENDPVRLTESCQNSNECSNGQECVAGRCFDVPNNNDRCAAGMMRQNCVCIAQRGPRDPSECHASSDCSANQECFSGQCIPTADYCTDQHDALPQGRRAVQEERAHQRAQCEARPYHVLSGDECVCDAEHGYMANSEVPGTCILQNEFECEQGAHRSWRGNQCQCDRGYAPLPGSDGQRPTCRLNAEVTCVSQQGHVWSTARGRKGCQCDVASGYVQTADPAQNGIPVCETRQARDARIRQEQERVRLEEERMAQLQEECTQAVGHIWVEDHCECDSRTGYLSTGNGYVVEARLFDVPLLANQDIPTCIQIINKWEVLIQVADERDAGTDADIELQVCPGQGYPRDLPRFRCTVYPIHRIPEEDEEDPAFERATLNRSRYTADPAYIIPHSSNPNAYSLKIRTLDVFGHTEDPGWKLESIKVTTAPSEIGDPDQLPGPNLRVLWGDDAAHGIATPGEITVLDTCLNLDMHAGELLNEPYVALPNGRVCN